ncbi:hypothetical protein HMPREF9723_02155 [Treponema denticola OTK]|uniref:Uncharacterized protein n=1 Tax=Treponema denticola OTK TaxID=999434 RepID=A0A0F6MNR3_TREDN|nr:BspA family leucine-rich repeat surface protein [Treponema denticola]EMB20695.1 hypothetical protein HMPREF9723_02155 [Treponema denticola OTK]
MASYDSETGIHTMTIYEAATYLKGLPQNTKGTPYKVNITGIDLTVNGLQSPYFRIRYLMQRPQYGSSLKSGERFLDLTATTIIIPPQCNKNAMFNECFFLVKPAKFIATNNNFGKVFEKTFCKCENLVECPEIPYGVTNIESAFEGCTDLTTTPYIPDSVTDMKATFAGCTILTTITNIPNSVKNLHLCFSNCKNLTATPYIPYGITDMNATFAGCTILKTVTNIPTSVTNMNATFNNCTNLTTVNLTGCTVNFSKVNMEACFHSCPNLKEFIYNVEYKEYNDWTLYLLKRIGNNLNIKRYSIETNTLIDEHTISLDNATNELDLLSKSDELLIDRAGNITDQQIDLLLKTKMEFGDKYSLDPQKKWLVVWADNPDNVRSNCFVTQQELKELKALLKTKHPDLF